jgi:hypothetical protein
VVEQSGEFGQSTSIRRCPCCEGAGCEECNHTGQRVVTYLERPGNVRARIQGNRPLSDEDAEAIGALIDAAYKQLGESAVSEPEGER